MRKSKHIAAIALVASFGLIAAACGSDAKTSNTAAPSTTTGGTMAATTPTVTNVAYASAGGTDSNRDRAISRMTLSFGAPVIVPLAMLVAVTAPADGYRFAIDDAISSAAAIPLPATSPSTISNPLLPTGTI